MNPRERWGLLLIDEFPDRPPVYPLVTSHAARIYDCNLIEYCTDGRTLAEAQMEAQRTYGHEGLSVFTDVGIIAEAMGSRYHLREFEVPILDQPLITNGAMIADLRIPDPTSQGRLPVYLEAIDRMYRAAGDVLPIFAFIPCPFTTAAGLRGVEEFLMDTILEPQQAHQLLDVSLKAAIRFSDECLLAGALPMLVDPLASGSVLSRETYSRFAQPYQQKFIAHLHRYDLDVTLHVCGDTTPMLDLIPETGADLFSFDQVDASEAMDAVGEAVRLVGNWPPHGLLPSSNLPVDRGTEAILATGLKNPKGFVLSTGCEVPIRCDCEKLHTLISRGKSARYENGR
jgi:uroporphyrinogen decarboxylase